MKPATFPQQNVVLNKNHENGYLPLPAYFDQKQWISKWELDDEDIAYILKERCIWFSMLTGRNKPYPIAPMCRYPFNTYNTMFCTLCYRTADHEKQVVVWMGVDAEPPAQIAFKGDIYNYDPEHRAPIYSPNYLLDQDSLYFRFPTPVEAVERRKVLLKEFDKVKDNLTDQTIKDFYQGLDKNSASFPILVEKGIAGKETVWF